MCKLPSISLARRIAGSSKAICRRGEEQSLPRGTAAAVVGQYFAQLHLIVFIILQTTPIIENLHDVGNLDESDKAASRVRLANVPRYVYLWENSLSVLFYARTKGTSRKSRATATSTMQFQLCEFF